MTSQTPSEPRSLPRKVSARGGRSLAERVLRSWAGARTFTVARGLVLVACAVLFLNAAATVELVYTLRLSYMLLAAACVVGLPFVVRGWRSLPPAWRWAAGLVAATYLLAAAAGSGETLAAQERAGAQRELVYLLDLALGLGTVGLLSGLFPGGRGIRLALGALLIGALVAAAYGIVQWPALHFDWPLANVNNALNPDAVTRGEVFQGNGLFLGWERVRGTFTEPLFFGLYLGSALPLVAAWLTWRRRRLAACALAAGVIGLALLLSSSFPSWALFTVAGMIGLILLSVGRGAVLPAALASGALALAGLGVAVVLFAGPEVLAKVTGREKAELAISSSARTSAWEQSVREWAPRPVLGHGPGQSSLRLAYRQSPEVLGTSSTPVVLGSAQGLLPAALIDAGLLGALAWIALVIACLTAILRRLVRQPSGLHLGLAVASLVAVGGGLVSGDRFEMQIWVVLGLALAATGANPRSSGGEPMSS